MYSQVSTDVKFLSAVGQEKLYDARIIDYDGDGEVVGVEFITPSLGMDMTGVPRATEIAREARKLGLRVRVAPSSAGS